MSAEDFVRNLTGPQVALIAISALAIVGMIALAYGFFTTPTPPINVPPTDGPPVS